MRVICPFHYCALYIYVLTILLKPGSFYIGAYKHLCAMHCSIFPCRKLYVSCSDCFPLFPLVHRLSRCFVTIRAPAARSGGSCGTPNTDPSTPRQKRKRLLDQHRLVWKGNIANDPIFSGSFAYFPLFVAWFTFLL